MNRWTAVFAVIIGFFAIPSIAQEASASFVFNGERVIITRSASATGVFTPASNDPCDANCIAPMQADAGIQTVDELQVLAFLKEVVAADQGLMVDARTAQERAFGYVPGSVNLPQATLSPNSQYRSEILQALGARELDGVYNFADARSLLVYDTGPASNEAGQLIQNLRAAGYPADKIKYYRGGMQVWSLLGFTVAKGQS